jgi:hypothetical protein
LMLGFLPSCPVSSLPSPKAMHASPPGGIAADARERDGTIRLQPFNRVPNM